MTETNELVERLKGKKSVPTDITLDIKESFESLKQKADKIKKY